MEFLSGSEGSQALSRQLGAIRVRWEMTNGTVYLVSVGVGKNALEMFNLKALVWLLATYPIYCTKQCKPNENATQHQSASIHLV